MELAKDMLQLHNACVRETLSVAGSGWAVLVVLAVCCCLDWCQI